MKKAPRLYPTPLQSLQLKRTLDYLVGRCVGQYNEEAINEAKTKIIDIFYPVKHAASKT